MQAEAVQKLPPVAERQTDRGLAFEFEHVEHHIGKADAVVAVQDAIAHSGEVRPAIGGERDKLAGREQRQRLARGRAASCSSSAGFSR